MQPIHRSRPFRHQAQKRSEQTRRRYLLCFPWRATTALAIRVTSASDNPPGTPGGGGVLLFSLPLRSLTRCARVRLPSGTVNMSSCLFLTALPFRPRALIAPDFFVPAFFPPRFCPLPFFPLA